MPFFAILSLTPLLSFHVREHSVLYAFSTHFRPLSISLCCGFFLPDSPSKAAAAAAASLASVKLALQSAPWQQQNLVVPLEALLGRFLEMHASTRQSLFSLDVSQQPGVHLWIATAESIMTMMKSTEKRLSTRRRRGEEEKATMNKVPLRNHAKKTVQEDFRDETRRSKKRGCQQDVEEEEVCRGFLSKSVQTKQGDEKEKRSKKRRRGVRNRKE